MRVTTAGESHGKGLFAILEGMPAGLKLDMGSINAELKRRQGGAGRSERQSIECDEAEILSGVRNLVTLGSPITLAVWNRDYANWESCMAPEGCNTQERTLTKVRPGHADYTGMKKFGFEDARNVLERASARETAARVAAGAICRTFLETLGVSVTGSCNEDIKCIEEAGAKGDTLGGVIELRIKGLKSGFGSCMTYAEKLDARLAAAIMSVQAIKGVEIGLGFGAADRFGSEVHDRLYIENGKIIRKTNHAGGIEGGMSNGEEIVLRAAMKPIPTLRKGLQTVDVATKEPAISASERSDVCALAACEVVLESAVCIELCKVILERLGGDTMQEVTERYGRLQ